VLAKFGHIESIPADWREWSVNAANASAWRDAGGASAIGAAVPNAGHAAHRHRAVSTMWMNWNGFKREFLL
jgi:hypothetical protein